MLTAWMPTGCKWVLYPVNLVNPWSSYLSRPGGVFTFISNADYADYADYTDTYGMNAYRVITNYYLVDLVDPRSLLFILSG